MAASPSREREGRGVDERALAALAAAAVATLGLWWFRLILKDARRWPKPTRYGVYALIWLAYFILVMAAIGLGRG